MTYSSDSKISHFQENKVDEKSHGFVETYRNSEIKKSKESIPVTVGFPMSSSCQYVQVRIY